MALLQWLHDTEVVSWIHSSDSLAGYTLYLALHTIGMVFLVGPSLLIAARVLGLAPDLPLQPLAAFRPVMKVGGWITLITGAVLFATDGANYVHNRVFMTKIVALVIALFCLRALVRELFDAPPATEAQAPSPRAKAITVWLMLMWTIGVVAGRLTAYSGIVVFQSVIAFLVLVGVVITIAYVRSATSARQQTQPAPVLRMDIQPTVVKGGK